MRLKTILQSCLLIAAFSVFFSCAKEDEVPLSFQDAKLTEVYAIEANMRSCKDRYFVDHSDSAPIYDVETWSAEFDLGRLAWSDDNENLEIVFIRFEVVNSQCIEDIKINIDDETMACSTYTLEVVDEDLPLQIAPTITMPWTPAYQYIARNSSVKFSKPLRIGGFTPKVPKGVDPKKYIPNCTARGLIKVNAVKFGESLSTGRNVRKSFPFSLVFQ